jgi:hypothetical protein
LTLHLEDDKWLGGQVDEYLTNIQNIGNLKIGKPAGRSANKKEEEDKFNLGLTLLNNLFINTHKSYKTAENEKIRDHLHSNFEDYLILSN